jgi:hypothetical protein
MDCLDGAIEETFGMDLLTHVYERSLAMRRPNQVPDWAEIVLRQGVGEGRREKMLFLLFSALEKSGLKADKIKEMLVVFNSKCRPPLPEKEFNYHVRYNTRRFFKE